MSPDTDPGIIDVTNWPQDEEHPFFPEGSRDKRLLRCPDPSPHPLLIPGHPYLFKKSREAYPDQLWAEIVAHRIGRLTGVEVPPAYPAWDANRRECAALIEWFYGHPNDPGYRYIPGSSFMKASIENYDLRRGTQHNFGTIEAWCRSLSVSDGFSLDATWPLLWAKMLTFDALIGNTDRHQENWGMLVWRPQAPEAFHFKLSPAFDNGTSLGHEIPPNQFSRFDSEQHMSRYVERGCHHMRWRQEDDKRAGHSELLRKLMERHPLTSMAICQVLDLDEHGLLAELATLTRLPLGTPLSEERARFMLRLVLARRARLRSTVKQYYEVHRTHS